MMEYEHKLKQTSRTLQAHPGHQSSGTLISEAYPKEGWNGKSGKQHGEEDRGSFMPVPNLEKSVSAKEVVQRMVVVVEHDYDRIKEPRTWNNVEYAETQAGGPIWDLGVHRSPMPNEREGKQLRFINHGLPGSIGTAKAQDLYALMTVDQNGLKVMKEVESVVFQSCYAGKDVGTTENNLTFLFAQLIALDSRLEKEKEVAVYGKPQISFGFQGIGDACAVLEDSKFHTRLAAIKDREGEGGSLNARKAMAEFFKKDWENFFEENKGGLLSRRRVIKTGDGAEKGWSIPENAGNVLIRKYIAGRGVVFEDVFRKGRRETPEPGQDVRDYLTLLENLI